VEPSASQCDASADSLVGRVVDEFLNRQSQGQTPDIEEYAARYPQTAALLRNVLQSLQLIDRATQHAPIDERDACSVASRVLGDFHIVREIGRGGMGIVYEAEQRSLGRRVALKVLPFAGMLDERARTRFKNEARAAAALEHPHIVPVFGSGEERGVYYYAMQLIRGRTLAELIAGLRQQNAACARASGEIQSGTGGNRGNGAESQFNPLLPPLPPVQYSDKPSDTHRVAAETPWPGGSTDTGFRAWEGGEHYRRAAEIGIQVAEALDYAHGRGIVHRDVKPSNLLLDKHGKVWVTDFGLAAIDNVPSLTLTGDLLGTLRYMSPEQATAERDLVDQRSDVYSLGAALYELLTLKPAFGQSARTALLKAVLEGDPVPLRRLNRDVPIALEVIVLTAMSKEPADRYRSAAAMADDLRRFAQAQPIAARRPGIVKHGRKLVRQHAAAFVNSIIVSAALVLAGAVTMSRGSRSADHESTAARPAGLNELIPSDSLTRMRGSVPVPPGLIAWWSGDGHPNDCAGAHHGTLQGGATYAPGLVGQAFSLDGAHDFIRVPHDLSLNPDVGYTIECWIRPNTAAGRRVIVSKWNDDARDWSYIFKIASKIDKLSFELSDSSRGDLAHLIGQESIGQGRWMHVAATYDTSVAKIYANGVQDAITKIDPQRHIGNGVVDVLIGGVFTGGGVNENFSGLIDEVSLYNRALSAEEILTIFQAGAAGKLKP